MTRYYRFLACLPSILAISACTMGPDYAGPPDLASAGENGSFVRTGDAYREAEPQLAKWWEVLGDPVLNKLEEQALAGNPDIAVAQARIDEASAALGEIGAQAYPTVSASALAAHLRVPGLDLGGGSDGESGGGAGSSSGSTNETSTTNLFNLGVQASWEVDLFGGHKRQVEAARAQLSVAEASLADAQIGLTSAVAQTYVNLRSRREALAIAEESVAQREAMLVLSQQLFDQGVSPAGAVESADQALQGAIRERQQLRAEAEIMLNALAVLTGAAPGAVDDTASGQAPPPLPPAEIAIGNPSTLIVQRPDIRAAERELAASSAQIGAVKAAGMPRLSFLGILGIGGTKISDLSVLDDFTAIGAPRLQWSFLDFGRNASQVAQVEARNAGQAAQYRKVVLQALREVEDSLTRFSYRREDVATLARIEQSAARQATLARQRFEEGAGSRLEMLEAEVALAQSQLALSQARAGLTLDFIAIQDALGLGWQGGEDATLAQAP